MASKKYFSILAASSCLTFGLAVPAVASPVVGPGSPLRMPFPSNKVVEKRHVGSPMCSLSTPGTITDKNGKKQRVILTAGHCVLATDEKEDGSKEELTGNFYVPTKDNGDVLLGRTVNATDNLDISDEAVLNPPLLLNEMFNKPDYGIIGVEDNVETTSLSSSYSESGENHGEPVQIVGIQDSRTLGEYEVAVDNFGQPICTDGSRTGRNCGVQLFRTRNGVWAGAVGIDHGDSGGNAYNPETRETIGMVSMGVGPLSRYQPADVALEETYGIEDGKVNEYFETESSTKEQSEFRTIKEDQAFRDIHDPQPPAPLDGTPLEGTPIQQVVSELPLPPGLDGVVPSGAEGVTSAAPAGIAEAIPTSVDFTPMLNQASLPSFR